jgi:uncharacterized glyoxalase superfamily protein PhnB
MAITPYLLYQDAGAALDWLAKAFGLRRTGHAYKGADGRISHGAMTLGEAQLMLGSPGPDFKNPKLLGVATQNLYVDVDDVAKHYARAVAAGANIIEQPTDTVYGARRYGAEDPEGHRWYFAQALSVAPPRAKKSSRKKAVGQKTPGRKSKRHAKKRSSRK